MGVFIFIRRKWKERERERERERESRVERSRKLTWKITRQPPSLPFFLSFQCIRLMGRPECRVPFEQTDLSEMERASMSELS